MGDRQSHFKAICGVDRKRKTAVSLFTLVVLAAGCGGGSSAIYSRAAFVACLQQKGAHTFGTNIMTSAQKAILVTFIGSADFVGAKFLGGEEDAFVFAADAAGAGEVEARLKRFAQSPLASAGLVKTKGNLVLLTPVHSTAGVQDILSACEASAKRT